MLENTTPASEYSTPVASAYISTSELAARFRRSPRTIWRWTNYPTFPKPVKSNPGSEALWLMSDILAWEKNGMQLRKTA